jgi:MFS family permease
MHLFAPDLLAEAHGLSAPVCAAGLALGALLWASGWWGHRFWIVLGTTLLAGILGLYTGRLYGLQPLVTGLLLAIGAGILALALVRLLAFAAGGAAACLLMQSVAPTWSEPIVCFLAGGLAGVLLFRVWTMFLTGFAGAVLAGYSGLCLADTLGQVDASRLAEQQPFLLSAAAVGVACLGMIVQFVLDRQRARSRRQREEKARVRRLTQELEQRSRQKTGRGWWTWGKSYRRAG